MTLRAVAVGLFALAATSTAAAQQNNVYSKAAPPEKAVLDRLNLKTEWTLNVPVEGNRDALTQVQTIGDQIFIQTRAGLFLAVDAQTGRIQWAARLASGSYGNSYPCTANERFVFVAHVTKLYAFYRYTGATEFVAELGAPPTTGLACDNTAVYCVLGMRAGNTGAHRIAVYALPHPIIVNDPVKGPVNQLSAGANPYATSPVDDLLKRYAPGSNLVNQPPDTFEPVYRPKVMEVPIVGSATSKTPSVSTLPSVVPPYSLDNRAPSPSLNTVPSLRQPYHLRLESGKYVQQTPSLGVIPPSVAASMILSDLRPKSVEPDLLWEYGLTARVLYPLTQTPTRLWVVTEGNNVVVLNKHSRPGKVVTEASERLASNIAATPSQAGLTNYIPLGNGTLLAVDAASGNIEGGLRVLWRATPGGLNNHSPFITEKFVYAAGDDTGVVCLHRFDGPVKGGKKVEPKADPGMGMPEERLKGEQDREWYAGDVVWKTSSDSADRVIGANKEFVYVRDRQGRFLVFDAARATDAARKRSVPLGWANFSEFNVHVINTASDRVYVAADNGLVVCMRDASPKYAKPVIIWPAPDINPPKQIGVEGGPKTDPGKDPEPKKDP